MQKFHRIERHPYRTSPCIACESERLLVCDAKEKLEMLSNKIRICKRREEKSEIQGNECESKMYAKEKEECEMFLRMFLKMWKIDAKKKCESIWNWKI